MYHKQTFHNTPHPSGYVYINGPMVRPLVQAVGPRLTPMLIYTYDYARPPEVVFPGPPVWWIWAQPAVGYYMDRILFSEN